MAYVISDDCVACGSCLPECPVDAISEGEPYVIDPDLCTDCGACAEVCPVECIVPGFPEGDWPWYYIDPDTCIDCGACIPECPVEAIFTEADVPEEFAKSTELNTAFFSAGPGYDSSP